MAKMQWSAPISSCCYAHTCSYAPDSRKLQGSPQRCLFMQPYIIHNLCFFKDALLVLGIIKSAHFL